MTESERLKLCMKHKSVPTHPTLPIWHVFEGISSQFCDVLVLSHYGLAIFFKMLEKNCSHPVSIHIYISGEKYPSSPLSSG
ncbi:unnamed protein product [Dovyalis caffra]|uniref:Uncharacterized protein n=1 Tax=Dovyalis caffra TaxID=77055 RepID=A0AAV1SEC1_9ROSI|nr:unnamed protein product [Dovyalis caffra]